MCSPWKLCTGVSLGIAAKILLNNGPAYCKAKTTRLIQRRPNLAEESSKFDWHKFLQYLWPHRWILGAAIAVSFTEYITLTQHNYIKFINCNSC